MRRTSASDQDVRQDRAEQAVEDDRLGEGEAEPLDALQLASKLGLACDRLDHRAEDVADADTGAERAETDAERKADRLAGLGDITGRRGDESQSGHGAASLLSARARSPSRCRWRTVQRR